jgi:hypothetical protein
MPLYFRKSVTAGPFRFNFSKSGVGMSVGVKGLRVGSGPRGHYIQAGRGGFYYRASLGGAGSRRASAPPRKLPDQPGDPVGAHAVDMTEVASGDVQAMRDEAFAELLDEINTKQQQASMAALLGWGVSLFGLAVLFLNNVVGVAILLLAVPAWAIGRWLDSCWRTTVLFYHFDDSVKQAYEALISAFDTMSACAGKWHVEAGGAITDLTTWKHNAGASRLVHKKIANLDYKLPSVIKSNLRPPTMYIGRRIIYFFPDVALIEDGQRMGAVGYKDLRIEWQNSNFIEDGRVPHDAEIIDHTWKHPNKDGGPDRRFNNNYRIPICRYEIMHFSSGSGVNELVEFSRTGVAEPFVNALKRLPKQATSAATNVGITA